MNRWSNQIKPINEWSRSWDNIFGFDKKFELYKNVNVKKGNYSHFKKSKSLIPYLRKNTIKPLTVCTFREGLNFVEYYREQIGSEYRESQYEIRKALNLNLKDCKYTKYTKDENITKVAIHIRRNDIINLPFKFLSNKYYINILKRIDKPDFRYFIFSDGKKSEFKEFSNIFPGRIEIYTKTEMSAQDTLQHLILADVLIMSKSKYSFYAGLVSESKTVKIYTPFFVSCPKHLEKEWIILDETKIL